MCLQNLRRRGGEKKGTGELRVLSGGKERREAQSRPWAACKRLTSRDGAGKKRKLTFQWSHVSGMRFSFVSCIKLFVTLIVQKTGHTCGGHRTTYRVSSLLPLRGPQG